NEGEAGYQQSFISGYRRDYVNGQFSLADLAPAWQQKLSASLPKPAAGTPLKPMLYFIGKYEVTARQYAAVMSQAAALSGQGEAPACDV
ncbi:type VI secretion protein, partial [Pseudomonas aeruginosa]|nr:type VI secretion protein [Pseudomonas aeruginosa]